MRLPTKPSALPTNTPTLPRRFDSVITEAMVSGDDFAPRTFSINRMMWAGLKKCVPMTLSGRVVAAAMVSMSKVDVLVARIAPGLQALSRASMTCFLISISSNTASMTMSASFKDP